MPNHLPAMIANPFANRFRINARKIINSVHFPCISSPNQAGNHRLPPGFASLYVLAFYGLLWLSMVFFPGKP